MILLGALQLSRLDPFFPFSPVFSLAQTLTLSAAPEAEVPQSETCQTAKEVAAMGTRLLNLILNLNPNPNQAPSPTMRMRMRMHPLNCVAA